MCSQLQRGKDMDVIKQITNVIESVEGVRLLDVDPGKDTNRTVVTFVGSPEEVVEAAFRAVKKASELIDMRKHNGAHPRFRGYGCMSHSSRFQT
jgi:glutamate formiminotransferase / formiminotetrahydrofolate cyclodeaminase